VTNHTALSGNSIIAQEAAEGQTVLSQPFFMREKQKGK
jgi:hypothetical protein